MTEKHLMARRRLCDVCEAREGCSAVAVMEDSNVSCPLPKPKWRGVGLLRSLAEGQVGDAVARVTQVLGARLGVGRCGGCERRRRRMNAGAGGRQLI